MMKKFLATTLAIALTMGMSLTAFAEEAAATTNSFKFTMNYTANQAGVTSPEETFSFTDPVCTNVEYAREGIGPDDAPDLTIAGVEYTEKDAKVDGNIKDIVVTYGTFPGVGLYTYTFSELSGDTAGVTYNDGVTYTLKIKVIQNEDGTYEIAEGGIGLQASDAKEKKGEIEHTYSAGTLEVNKQVAGGMADKNETFTAEVTFKAELGTVVKAPIYMTNSLTPDVEAVEINFVDGVATATDLTLKHGHNITFTNIPYGVSYKVEETEDKGYDPGYDNDTKSGTISAPSVSTTIINTKDDQSIDTGIITDNMPYVVLLAIAFVGMVVFFMKKRSAVR